MTSTTDTTLEERLLKQDRLGRVQTSSRRRAELLAEYERSGMSGQQFATYVGVKYPTFATWLAKANKNVSNTPSATIWWRLVWKDCIPNWQGPGWEAVGCNSLAELSWRSATRTKRH